MILSSLDSECPPVCRQGFPNGNYVLKVKQIYGKTSLLKPAEGGMSSENGKNVLKNNSLPIRLMPNQSFNFTTFPLYFLPDSLVASNR
jgi:hypothetical protein